MFMRALIWLHRYLGIGLGWLLVVWCLSGVVMIYWPYPHVDAETRVRGLEPLDWRAVEQLAQRVDGPGGPFSRFQLEMMAGSPVLRLWAPEAPMRLVQLAAPGGAALSGKQALAVAARYVGNGGGRAVPAAELIDYDQWTVGGSRRDRPLYHVAMGDNAGTEVYVSPHSGLVVQSTTRAQRFWGWLGAVPHWLYLSSLRSHPQVWTQVVIWTSLLGVFLTVMGLVIGIRALVLSGKLGRYSPYRGVMLWHHLVGLVFGVFALTWVLSGLFSMNPWGLMEGGDIDEAQARLSGKTPDGVAIAAVLRNLAVRAPVGVLAIDSAPLDGKVFTIGTRAGGTRERYNEQGESNALGTPEISAAVARLTQPGASWVMLGHEDAYHYGVATDHASLPVVRTVSSDGIYYYLDPVSGELVDRADGGERQYRWWFSALHRLDFVQALRTSLGRNLVMLPLLLGALVVTSLGAYLGIRRLTRKA
jgi:uncharacterized iron-regulated membrane protein